MLAAASLELKAEKQSAHSSVVASVAFSPDGKTIVSGSWDKTLKVWDAGASMPPCPSACKTDPYQSSLHSLSRVEGDEGERAQWLGDECGLQFGR